jgi:hypothetical protein
MTRPITSACVAALIACGTAGAAAAETASHARQCFFSSELSSWREVGDKQVNLRVGVSDVYRLDLIGHCLDLPFAETIGIETRGGSSEICSGLDVNLIVPQRETHAFPERCMATSLRKLSKAEVDALPRGQRP